MSRCCWRKMGRATAWLSGVCFLSGLVMLLTGSLTSLPPDCSHVYAGAVADSEALQKEISVLKEEVLKLQLQLNESRQLAASNVEAQSLYKNKALFYEKFFKERIELAEILKGVAYNNEYEQLPFVLFTMTRVYIVDPGLGKRVIEKPIALKKKDFLEVIGHGMTVLNGNKGLGVQFTPDDFVEGIFRTLPTHGAQYELFYHHRQNPASSYKVIVARPFGPLYDVQVEVKDTHNIPINIIVPLSGRVDVFSHFVKRLIGVCSGQLAEIMLTVVYYADNSTAQVTSIIDRVKAVGFGDVKLVLVTGTFSRGQALQAGVQAWTHSRDVLMFFCDVDVWFTTEYLDRCRRHTVAGQRVYYPIVFSLFNPHAVYSLEGVDIPSLEDQLIISKNTGFWRDFGYGMTCQYRSDFLAMRGFDDAVPVSGWGLEDVNLYKKYVRSRILVVRATDPAVFHLWHEKHCSSSLSLDQYKGCIRSKALNEASHAQLGMLAFKEEIAAYRNLTHLKPI